MEKEVTSQDVLIAVKELANQVSEIDKNLNGKIDSLDKHLSNRMDSLETRLDTMDKGLKQEFNKVNDKIDVIDTQITLLSGSLNKTQAEVKILQNAKWNDNQSC